METLKLIEARDAHFAWLLTDTPGFEDLAQPQGGLDHDDVIPLLRGIAAAHRAQGRCGMWLIVLGREVVGSCGYMRPITDDAAEIGYGIARSRWRRGYATQAVTILVELARCTGLSSVTAGTSTQNRASQIVLERNGFARRGFRHDPDDGEIIEWFLSLNAPRLQPA